MRYFTLIDKWKAIWVQIPKSASGSFRYLLHYEFNKKRRKKIRQDQVCKYPDHFKFAFVRNPYDRIESFYVGKILKGDGGRPYVRLLACGLSFEDDFETFVERIAGMTDEDIDVHMKSMDHIIGPVKLDYTGRFETICDDFGYLKRKFLIKHDLPHINRTKKKFSFNKWTNKTRELIYNRYKKDFERFGYEA